MRLLERGGAGRPLVVVLSAEYGFIDAETEIPDYNRRLDRPRALELLGDAGQAAALSRLIPGDAEVFLGGGRLYRETALACLNAAGHRGAILAPHDPRGIGDLLAALKAYLMAGQGVDWSSSGGALSANPLRRLQSAASLTPGGG